MARMQRSMGECKAAPHKGGLSTKQKHPGQRNMKQVDFEGLQLCLTKTTPSLIALEVWEIQHKWSNCANNFDKSEVLWSSNQTNPLEPKMDSVSQKGLYNWQSGELSSVYIVFHLQGTKMMSQGYPKTPPTRSKRFQKDFL